MDEIIPIFPLDLVLLPGQPLPLRIFEPRYKQMMDDCILDERPFGVCRVDLDTPVRGWTGAVELGTTCGITHSEEEGTNLVLETKGLRRFRILEMIEPVLGPLSGEEQAVFPTVESLMTRAEQEGKLYLRARIEYLAEVEGVVDQVRWLELVTIWRGRFRAIARIFGMELDMDDDEIGADQINVDSPQVEDLYTLARGLSADGDGMQQILEAGEISEILDILEDLIEGQQPQFTGIEFDLDED